MSGICDTCKRNKECRKPMYGMDSCRLYLSGKESNYKRLFGTPERTVETLAAIMLMSRYPCGENGVTDCGDCPLDGAPCRLNRANPSESELVEWLKGEVSTDE